MFFRGLCNNTDVRPLQNSSTSAGHWDVAADVATGPAVDAVDGAAGSMLVPVRPLHIRSHDAHEWNIFTAELRLKNLMKNDPVVIKRKTVSPGSAASGPPGGLALSNGIVQSGGRTEHRVTGI